VDACEARHGRDEDDAAAIVLLHVLRHGLAGDDGANVVDTHKTLELGYGENLEVVGMGHASRGNDDVNRLHSRGVFRHHASHVLFIRNIRGEVHDFGVHVETLGKSLQLRRGLIEDTLRTCDDSDRCSTTSNCFFCGCQTDSTGSTSDQDILTLDL